MLPLVIIPNHTNIQQNMVFSFTPNTLRAGEIAGSIAFLPYPAPKKTNLAALRFQRSKEKPSVPKSQ